MNRLILIAILPLAFINQSVAGGLSHLNIKENNKAQWVEFGQGTVIHVSGNNNLISVHSTPNKVYIHGNNNWVSIHDASLVVDKGINNRVNEDKFYLRKRSEIEGLKRPKNPQRFQSDNPMR